MSKLTVYTAPGRCVQCDAVKRWLKKEGVDFDEKDGTEHVDYLASLGYRQAPITVTANGEAFYGYDINKLQQIAAGG